MLVIRNTGFLAYDCLKDQTNPNASRRIFLSSDSLLFLKLVLCLGAKRARFFLDQKEIHHSRELGWIFSNKWQ
jgi:hypothetical protein